MNQHKEACAVARRSAYRHESDGPHVHAAAGTSAEAPAGFRDLQLLVRKQLPQFGFGQFGERDVRA